jgi:hypothetical protein
VIYETQTGVIEHIKPINLATLRAIQLKAADLFPYPDKTPYRHLEENAFAEGQLSPAEDNPEYLLACKAVDAERSQWTDKAIFNFAVRFPKYPTRQALIDAFADELEALRQIAVLPDDDYEAVVFHLVLSWNQVGVNPNNRIAPISSDFSRSIQLAIQTVALTPDEVTAGVRFFRPQISERRAGTAAR